MGWNYAELSKSAKEVGGPEKLMDILVESGKVTGRKEMLPIVGIALGIGALGYAGIKKFANYFNQKAKVSPEAVQLAKEELIQGIKDYDEKQLEIERVDCDVPKENESVEEDPT